MKTSNDTTLSGSPEPSGRRCRAAWNFNALRSAPSQQPTREAGRPKNNQAMQRKLTQRAAIDISQCERTVTGDYVLMEFDGGKDYCDATAEAWVWSIARVLRPLPSVMANGERRVLQPGEFLASTTARFYVPNEKTPFECVWLR
jgi:hypothetical protein